MYSTRQTRTHRKALRLIATAIAAVSVAAVSAACGSSSQASSSPRASGCQEASAPSSTSATQWKQIVDGADKEGGVTLYSAQGSAILTEFTTCFEQAYPQIKLNAIYLADNNALAKIDAELETGRLVADMWVTTVKDSVAALAQGGKLAAPAGPNFTGSAYLAQYIHDDSYFEVGGTVAVFAWNTNLYPAGLKSYRDLLDPKLSSGKIGVLQASVSPTAIDFYLYLTKLYGASFLTQLAAQKPRVYPNGGSMDAALQSGEIEASIYTHAANITAGAPVKVGVISKPWGAPYYGAIIKNSPHPDAAQVLANFMISTDGQQALDQGDSAVLPNISGAVTTNNELPAPDPRLQQPAFVSQYDSTWTSLFH
jgi:iron(III) transport system substrate-binding protein